MGREEVGLTRHVAPFVDDCRDGRWGTLEGSMAEVVGSTLLSLTSSSVSAWRVPDPLVAALVRLDSRPEPGRIP